MLLGFNATMLQPFDASMFQSFDASMLQCFNASMLRLLNALTLQRFNSSTVQWLNVLTLSSSMLQRYSTVSTVQPFQPKRDHCKRAILFLSSSKILTPHPPLRPASVYHRARIISPLPLHVAKTGRNHLNEEFTPLLPTGIGERF